MFSKSKQKGNVSALQGYALALVVLVIIVAVGAQILGKIQATQTASTTEYNTTTKGLTAMSQFGDWFSIIVIIVIAVVIIALLLGAFRGAGGA